MLGVDIHKISIWDKMSEKVEFITCEWRIRKRHVFLKNLLCIK